MYKCLNCNNEISTGDIFMKLCIDMIRLIYGEADSEEKFLVPDGPVRFKQKIYLCENCSRDLMKYSPKAIAEALVTCKN